MDDKYYWIIGIGILLVAGIGIWYGSNSGQAYMATKSKVDTTNFCMTLPGVADLVLGGQPATVTVSDVSRDMMSFQLNYGKTKTIPEKWAFSKTSLTFGGYIFQNVDISTAVKEGRGCFTVTKAPSSTQSGSTGSSSATNCTESTFNHNELVLGEKWNITYGALMGYNYSANYSGCGGNGVLLTNIYNSSTLNSPQPLNMCLGKEYTVVLDGQTMKLTITGFYVNYFNLTKVVVNCASPTTTLTCTDSDIGATGGLYATVQGTVTYNNTKYTDYCVSNDTVREYSCLSIEGPVDFADRNSIYYAGCQVPSQGIPCDTVSCINGALKCVHAQATNITCTDSDGGVNFAVKGQVVGPIGAGEGSNGWDYCFTPNQDGSGTPGTTGTKLLEWSCIGNGAQQNITTCNCSDGKCLSAAPACGGLNQACCTTGVSCTATTTRCNETVCLHCGDLNERCCSGDTCSAGKSCSSNSYCVTTPNVTTFSNVGIGSQNSATLYGKSMTFELPNDNACDSGQLLLEAYRNPQVNSQEAYTNWTYTLEGTNYEVRVLGISNNPYAVFSVKGENSDSLHIGDSYTFSSANNIRIKVMNITVGITNVTNTVTYSIAGYDSGINGISKWTGSSHLPQITIGSYNVDVNVTNIDCSTQRATFSVSEHI